MCSKDFASRLRTSRESKGLNKSDLAELLGVSRPTYLDMENGKVAPRLDVVDRLAEILGCSSSWLAYGTESKNTQANKQRVNEIVGLLQGLKF